jgi:hypothetical protein
MSSGPSKEELEMYWKNSRQYFDELANYYKTADPVYYNQYIAPFYSNPFNQTASSNRSSGSKMALLFAFVAFMIIAAAGVGVFFFVSKEQEKTDYKEKYIDQPEDKNQKEDTKSAEQDTFPDDEFLLGAKYLAEKDYDKAEEHLKKVNPGDRNYKEAQQLLKNIKYLRKYNK